MKISEIPNLDPNEATTDNVTHLHSKNTVSSKEEKNQVFLMIQQQVVIGWPLKISQTSMTPYLSNLALG